PSCPLVLDSLLCGDGMFSWFFVPLLIMDLLSLSDRLLNRYHLEHIASISTTREAKRWPIKLDEKSQNSLWRLRGCTHLRRLLADGERSSMRISEQGASPERGGSHRLRFPSKLDSA